MGLKEFLKPTKGKIITSLIIPIVLETWFVNYYNANNPPMCEMVCDPSKYPVLLSGFCKCPGFKALISDIVLLIILFVILFSITYSIYSLFTRKRV